MPRALAATVAATVAAALAALPMTPRAEPPEGRILTDQGQIEILSRPLRAGDRIELPEGYLIVEEDGPETTAVGSFGVVPAGALAAGSGQSLPSVSPDDGAGPAAGPGAPPSCSAERSAFLAELWKESGIDVKDPAAVLDGLEAGASGPATGYYWFALHADPFRSLAWSSALRARADALARCVRAGGSAAAAGDAASPALAGR